MADDENNNTGNNKDQQFDPGRRRFVKNTGMVVGGVAGGSLLGGLLTDQLQTEEKTAPKDDKSEEAYSEARMFFTRFDDFVVLEQATERIYPENDNGPGAIELGVPYFIDKQLAGSYGMNAKDYRHKPFTESNPPPDRSRMTRGELFITGLHKMNDLSQKRFDTTFDEAKKEQQTEILQDFEKDKIDMKGVSSGDFFEFFRGTVIEGVYSDPLYGGNKNMRGWKMMEYPGARSSYDDVVGKDEFEKIDPVSLTNYQQKS